MILSERNTLFAWLPVESVIHRNQEDYYRVISLCNHAGDSTEFISDTLAEVEIQNSDYGKEQVKQ